MFRDAERAVLRQTPDAFPELGHLPPEVRKLVLWHRQGHPSLRSALRVPGPLPRLLGDQDGLFASACNQYRASMNHVADWAREQRVDGPHRRGVRAAAGEPAGGAHEPALAGGAAPAPRRLRLRSPRGRRGAARGLRAAARASSRSCWPARRCSRSSARRRSPALARTARPLTFGPMERIIVQGQEGDSLFVVVEGTVEVWLRRDDGLDVNLGTRPHGTVLGEMSLLTGEPRSATVRSIDGAVVYEVGRRAVRADPRRAPGARWTRSRGRWRRRLLIQNEHAGAPRRRAPADHAPAAAARLVAALAPQEASTRARLSASSPRCTRPAPPGRGSDRR